MCRINRSNCGRIFLFSFFLLLICPDNLRAGEVNPSALDLIPSYGHFRRGEWQKGVSDLWNTWLAIWAFLEPNATIGRWQEDIDHNLEPLSRKYVIIKRNIEIYRDLQFWILTVVFVNYVNGLLDLWSSKDGESFLGVFTGIHAYGYDTYVIVPDGFEPYSGVVAGPYFGMVFGYRGLLESHMRMFFPMPGVHYANWHTDYVFPRKRGRNLHFALGVGFVTCGYMNTLDWDKVDKVIDGGLGMHLRLRMTYTPSHAHTFDLTLAPYIFQTDLRAFDISINDDRTTNHERFTRGHFPDNFGFEFVYRYSVTEHFNIETLLGYSRATEPGGHYIKRMPDDSGVILHVDGKSSNRGYLSITLNYRF